MYQCRVIVCRELLLSKLVIQAQNVLISEVDVHLRYISLSIEAHNYVIIICEVIVDFWHIILVKKKIRLSLEGLRDSKWTLK